MDERPRILIIDDDAIARETLTEHLLRDNYAPFFASGGAEAFELLEQVNPDLILLDVMMPGVNGYEVCRNLKSQRRWQHVPVILITALDTQRDLLEGLAAGADEFLTKPVSRAELRTRVRSMIHTKKQYDEIQSHIRLREDLVHMVVHDIKNILTAVSFNADFVLHRHTLKPDEKEAIQTIRSQIARLESFTNDMLLAAKMSQGKMLLNQTEASINQLIQQQISNYHALAQGTNINLVVELPEESRLLFIDTHLFSRVIDNLLSNAFKFSPPSSTVTLRLAHLPNSVQLQVADAGPGIPEAHRERIFDKFAIVELKKRGVPQTGLGLAFCQMVVAAHNGRIFVEPNTPQGSIFTIELHHPPVH